LKAPTAIFRITELSGTSNALTTSYTYAYPFDLVASVKDPLGGVTKYACSAAGDVTAVTDPLGNVSKFTYDVLG
jgi:uncharacterized protein RhaS with RHS repeats